MSALRLIIAEGESFVLTLNVKILVDFVGFVIHA